MKTACIINNFNYENFVVDAVNSAKEQSVPFDEIIVVDDCSTDGSVQVLKEHFDGDERVKLIFKEKNEGQLSSFNVGFLASSGDLIFFLDSDDLYNREYLEDSLNFYKENATCDFLFCCHKNFGEFAPPDEPESQSLIDDYGYSVISVFYLRRWIGGPTSTISMRRSVLEKVLPIPYVEDWRTRADDCLVYGSSLVGARKFGLNKKLVKYRFHGSNNLQGQGKKLSEKYYTYKRELGFIRLYSYICEKMNYKSELAELIDLEFKTIANPTRADFLLYIKIIRLSKLGWSKKIKRIATIARCFFSSQKKQ